MSYDHFCSENVLAFSAVHVPGMDNWATDFLSWTRESGNTIQRSVRSARGGAPQTWTSLLPILIKKVPVYMARAQDHLAIAVDALIIP